MKKILLIALALSAALRAAAQTLPLSDINKPQLPMQVSDSLSRFDLTFDYSIFNRPYNDLYDFNPYEAVRLQTVGPNKVPYFYAKLGAQYPLIPTAELYFQTKPAKGFCAGLYGRHNSFLGTLPDVASGVDVKNFKMNNSAGGAVTYDWATGELMFDAQYNFDRLSYDAGPVRSLSKNANLLLSMNINSAHVEDKSIFYDITAKYKNSTLEQTLSDGLNGIKENYLKVAGYVGATFDIHRVNVNMNIEFAKYGNMKDYSTGVVEFSPIYEIDRRYVKARLGVKFGTTYGIGQDKGGQQLGVENNIFPDIDARFTLIDKILWVRTVVSGGEDLNQMSHLVTRCPVVDLTTGTEFGVRNLDSHLSVESVLFGRLAINLLGSYVIYTDKLYFAPMTEADPVLCRVQAAYMDVNQLSYGLETFWKSQDVTLGGKMQFHSYKERGEDAGKVTQFPEFTASAFLRYSFRERIIASLDISYRSRVSGTVYGVYEVPAVLDASANVNFLLNRHLAVFFKCGNIFGSRNQYMPMYLEPGRNFGGGICVNF